MKTYDEFLFEISNRRYCKDRIKRLLESETSYEEDNVVVTLSKICSIRKFFEATNDYNRSKISNLINNDIGNIDKVYNIVLEWVKHTRK